MVVTYYIKLFRTVADRLKGISLSSRKEKSLNNERDLIQLYTWLISCYFSLKASKPEKLK